MRFVTIVGARPQFIKLALLSRALRKRHKEVLVHTGQHYDKNLSEVFFKKLGIAEPDYNLNISGGSQIEQVAEMSAAVERVLVKEKPGVVIVYGDTNSTLAGALAAAKLNIPLAHVEAGLRSYRMDMPEEINRLVTDHLSTLLFCPTHNAVENLRKEGIVKGVYNTGDIMYDTLLHFIKKAQKSSGVMRKLNLERGKYFLITVHRAENTDSMARLKKITRIINSLDHMVIFPVHPRTAKALRRLSCRKFNARVKLIEPVGYFDMLVLEANAKVILTDSGGVQREAYFLNVPCITLRKETEWGETVKSGFNCLVDLKWPKIREALKYFSKAELSRSPDVFGRGRSADKMLDLMEDFYAQRR